jgi:hypothetical protein
VNIIHPKQPNKVYRYQKFSARTLVSLCRDELYFASPKSFNDPFDCDPTIKSNSDKDTLCNILVKLVSKRIEAEAIASFKKVKLSDNKVLNYAKKLGRDAANRELQNAEYYATDPEYECGVDEAECRFLTSRIKSELLESYDKGICCFAITCVNSLLWSHYGDQHNGICIGYSPERKPKPDLHKVGYGGSRTVETSLIAKALLRDNAKAKEILDRKILLRKAPPWRYEREWRLLGNRGIHESVLALKDITFGPRCPYAIVHSVIAALSAREDKIKFYKIYEEHGSFKLNRRLVNIGEIENDLPRTARSATEDFADLKI